MLALVSWSHRLLDVQAGDLLVQGIRIKLWDKATLLFAANIDFDLVALEHVSTVLVVLRASNGGSRVRYQVVLVGWGVNLLLIA